MKEFFKDLFDSLEISIKKPAKNNVIEEKEEQLPPPQKKDNNNNTNPTKNLNRNNKK